MHSRVDPSASRKFERGAGTVRRSFLTILSYLIQNLLRKRACDLLPHPTMLRQSFRRDCVTATVRVCVRVHPATILCC
jgi:hypothetical protein